MASESAKKRNRNEGEGIQGAAQANLKRAVIISVRILLSRTNLCDYLCHTFPVQILYPALGLMETKAIHLLSQYE